MRVLFNKIKKKREIYWSLVYERKMTIFLYLNYEILIINEHELEFIKLSKYTVEFAPTKDER